MKHSPTRWVVVPVVVVVVVIVVVVFRLKKLFRPLYSTRSVMVQPLTPHTPYYCPPALTRHFACFILRQDRLRSSRQQRPRGISRGCKNMES